MSAILEGLDNLIEAEVERRVQQRLASQAGLVMESVPDIAQPPWYGSIRRTYGWPKWRHVSHARKLFLASFGAMLQDKAVDRFRGAINVICDILTPFAEALQSFMESPTAMRADVKDEDLAADWAIGCEVTIGQWRRLGALFDKFSPHRQPSTWGPFHVEQPK